MFWAKLLETVQLWGGWEHEEPFSTSRSGSCSSFKQP